MKIKTKFSLLLALIICGISLQSCDQISKATSKSKEEASADTEGVTSDDVEEMSIEERNAYEIQHQKDLMFVTEKVQEINNEHIHKSDRFKFECTQGTVEVERQYNDDDQVHLLTYSICKDGNCSTKHHHFWEDHLIYQFYHHEVTEGDKQVVDDHRTYFKEGEMIRCLEAKYSYGKQESVPHDFTYEQVDCVPADKLTKDIEKLITASEEEVKEYFCK